MILAFIPSSDVHLVVVPSVVALVVISIDHREQFTTKGKFPTQNELLEWVREEARKLGFALLSVSQITVEMVEMHVK